MKLEAETRPLVVVAMTIQGSLRGIWFGELEKYSTVITTLLSVNAA